MLIRQLKSEEFEERMRLSEFAFQYKISPERLEEERRNFRPEEHWGAFDEQGRLLSALVLIPFEIYVEGRTMLMGGLAGVASWPETRRGGNVAKLLARSLEVMREQGQTISMLHPFYFPFYRKFGWEFTVERKRYEIEMALLPKPKESAGYVARVEKEAAAIEALYNDFASGYNGMLKRSEEWWRRRVLNRDGIVAVWHDDSGSAKGYIFYEVMNRTMTVHDWAWADDEARNGLLHFIANHDSMADRVSVTVPADDDLAFLLPDPRFKQELVPYFMTRIVDAEALLRQYPFRQAECEEELTLDIEDSHAPWNDGRFRIAFGADGTARVLRSPERPEIDLGAGRATNAASCDIQALAAMLLGNRRPLRLHEAGLLRGTREAAELLERRVPVRPSYLADFF